MVASISRIQSPLYLFLNQVLTSTINFHKFTVKETGLYLSVSLDIKILPESLCPELVLGCRDIFFSQIQHLNYGFACSCTRRQIDTIYHVVK
jgi:hypothetical protein